jgi:hypothetical protein
MHYMAKPESDFSLLTSIISLYKEDILSSIWLFQALLYWPD